MPRARWLLGTVRRAFSRSVTAWQLQQPRCPCTTHRTTRHCCACTEQPRSWHAAGWRTCCGSLRSTHGMYALIRAYSHHHARSGLPWLFEGWGSQWTHHVQACASHMLTGVLGAVMAATGVPAVVQEGALEAHENEGPRRCDRC